MPQYHDITYPVPKGNPPVWTDMEYDVGTGLLPLEKGLLKHMFEHSEMNLKNSLEDIEVFGRQHTVVGHYSEFSPEPRDVPENPNDDRKDEVTFFIEGCSASFGAIFYIYYNKVDCIEIYGLGENFPNDGIIRSITAITSGDPNKKEWQESISK